MPPILSNGHATTASHAIFDYEDTMLRLNGDRDLYDDLVRFFLEDSEEHIHRLRAKLIAEDLRGIELCAHSLNGLCANFGARRAMAAAQCLENATRRGATAELSAAARELEEAVAQLRYALTCR